MSLSSYQPTFETHPPEPALPAWPEPALPAWKVELNAKLAAHRERRPSSIVAESENQARPERVGEGSARASRVAARVAERYAKAPSYSEFLAASAAAATAAAQTAAFAARQAQEAAESFARLSTERDASERESWRAEQQDAGDAQPLALVPAPVEDRPSATVEHPQPLPARGVVPPRPSAASTSLFGNAGGIVDAFAEATVPAAIGLPAKLIEFPRELVAARKSRPRIAEGPLVEAPLFEQADPASLRIFEVEGAEMAGDQRREFAETGASVSGESQGSSGREGASRAGETGAHRPAEEPRSTYSAGPEQARSAAVRQEGAPAWQSIRLGEHPVSQSTDPEMDQEKPLPQDHRSGQTQPVLHTASVGDRAMAALVDIAMVGLAFLLFVLVFAACTAHPPLDRTALVCGGLVLGGLFLFYQWLFMSFGGGTLGMRYAQIAICTFEDENPTRQTMRRRVGASLLSLLPLGLGFLWALFDEDSLSWHDRMTRCYQRSYR